MSPLHKRPQAWALVGAVLGAACLPVPGSNQSGDAAQVVARAAAPGAELRDQEFESFMANVDLRKPYGARADEIVDAIRSTRSKVAASVKAASARPATPRQAALSPVAPPPIFMTLIFAEQFGGSLDAGTGGPKGTGAIRPAGLNSSEDGPTTTTKTSLSTATDVSASGSRVQLTEHWTYRTSTTDKASGAVQLDMTDDRTIVGNIDVCPDGGGLVTAYLTSHLQSVASVPGGSTTTRTTTATSTFSGQVDDSAVLRTVSQDVKVQSSWEGATPGTFTYTASGSWPASEAGIIGTLDAVKGTLTSTGQPRADSPIAAGTTVALDESAVALAYKEAQRLWRHGRCVAVLVEPDGGDVERDSVTTVTAKVKHKIDGNELDKPVEAKMGSGVKSIEPSGQKQKAPATYRYTAGSDIGAKGGVSFESVSNRGIGSEGVTFTVAGAAWTINATGSSNETAPPATKTSLSVAIKDLRLSSGLLGVTGSGTITLSGTTGDSLVGCFGQVGLTAQFTAHATLIGSGPDAVLRLTLELPGPVLPEPGTLVMTCRTVTIRDRAVGFSERYGRTLGQIDLPAAGGTKTISRSTAFGPILVDATATLTVVRR